MMDTVSVPVFEWSGTPRAIGRQHGESRRSEIIALAAVVRDRYATHDQDRLDEHLRHLLAESRVFAPDLADELDGIAEGAGTDVLNIVALNAFLDLINVSHTDGIPIADDGAGCTVFAATPASTADGKMYIGQNYDVWRPLRDAIGYAVIRPTRGPDHAVLAFAGTLGCAGLNSAGIGVAINFLDAADVGGGVLYPFFVRAVLARSRIGDAIGTVISARRACGMHYLIGDATGMVASVETSGQKHAVIFPDAGVIAHANHYLAAELRDLDLMLGLPSYNTSASRRGSTLIRQRIADAALAERAGSLGLADLTKICSDHHNYPYSVCFHGDPDAGDVRRSETVTSFVMELTERRIYVSDGCGHAAHLSLDLSL